MIDFSSNYFELFGMEPAFRFDAATLDHAYRALQSDVHPDRYASGTDVQRRVAMQSSARVNEAYRALKDPVRRAQYLLSLNGVDAADETDTRLPLDFLERQLERRETAEEAAASRDTAALEALEGEVRAEARALEDGIAKLLDGEHAWEAASMRVRELTFLAKLAEDVDAMLGALDD